VTILEASGHRINEVHENEIEYKEEDHSYSGLTSGELVLGEQALLRFKISAVYILTIVDGCSF
jgi:hypothetical protein